MQLKSPEVCLCKEPLDQSMNTQNGDVGRAKTYFRALFGLVLRGKPGI